ncbi:MAG: hypothetical protein GY761_04415 [Hyphomicrobiales bacterium]|nr:hypothetical protein [Hyphomicrobiales bacterium]
MNEKSDQYPVLLTVIVQVRQTARVSLFTRKHLMDQSSSLGKAQNAVPSGWSDKFCNAADELAWFTEGWLFTLNGLRYGFFMVNQSKAETVPCQQT